MKAAIILFAGIVMLSCCAPGKKAQQSMESLYDTKWSLKKIHDANGAEDVTTKAFIRFDKEKGSAGGNGSCNSFGSNFTVNNDAISFKNIFSTKVYCDDVQKTENAYFNQLEKTNRFELKDKKLLLYKDSDLLLEFGTE